MLDIVAVAAGFVLRAIGGATATGIPISEWFFIVTSFGALFMVAGKRHGELSDLEEHEAVDVRPTLAAYTPTYLAYLRAVFSGGVLIAYCMWAFNSAESNGNGAIWYPAVDRALRGGDPAVRPPARAGEGRRAREPRPVRPDPAGRWSRVGHHLRLCHLCRLSRLPTWPVPAPPS